MRLKIYGLLLSYLLISNAMTQQAWAESTVKFHGTLVAASCTPDAIDVEFDDVSLDNVANRRAAKPFKLNLNCTGNIGKDIQYKFSGLSSSFDVKLLKTDMKGLGIEIDDGDLNTALAADTWYALGKDVRSKSLLALLVRNSTETFAGGEFSATATFSVQLP